MNHSQNERRQNERLYHHARVEVTTSANTKILASTLNLSDSGLLLKGPFGDTPKIGEMLEIQALDFPDAPIKRVIVRRISDIDQIGVEFL